MFKIENCVRCGVACTSGGVYTPQSGNLCHDCFNAKEWKEIQTEANRNALPWKILFWVVAISTIIQIIV